MTFYSRSVTPIWILIFVLNNLCEQQYPLLTTVDIFDFHVIQSRGYINVSAFDVDKGQISVLLFSGTFCKPTTGVQPIKNKAILPQVND